MTYDELNELSPEATISLAMKLYKEFSGNELSYESIYDEFFPNIEKDPKDTIWFIFNQIYYISLVDAHIKFKTFLGRLGVIVADGFDNTEVFQSVIKLIYKKAITGLEDDLNIIMLDSFLTPHISMIKECFDDTDFSSSNYNEVPTAELLEKSHFLLVFNYRADGEIDILKENAKNKKIPLLEINEDFDIDNMQLINMIKEVNTKREIDDEFIKDLYMN